MGYLSTFPHKPTPGLSGAPSVEDQRDGEAEVFKPSPLGGKEGATAEDGLSPCGQYGSVQRGEMDGGAGYDAGGGSGDRKAGTIKVDEDEQKDEGGCVEGHQRVHKNGEEQQERGSDPKAIDGGSEREEAQRSGERSRSDVGVHEQERCSGKRQREKCSGKHGG